MYTSLFHAEFLPKWCPIVTCLALFPSEPLWAVTYHQVHTLSARPTILTNIDLTGLEVCGDQLNLRVNEQCIYSTCTIMRGRFL